MQLSITMSQVFSLYLSTFAMVLIGFDRLKAVRHPMRRALSSDRSCMKPIICAWFVSGVLASPQVINHFYKSITPFFTIHRR